MSVAPYPEYKDSGVEWIGAIPRTWGILPIKRIARLCTDRADEQSFPVALENIQSWTGAFTESDATYEGEGVSFRLNDILFGKLRPYLAKAWLADRQGEAIGDFHVIRCFERYYPDFLKRVLLTREIISLIDGSTHGAKMPRAGWDFMGSIQIPLPTLEEQATIAAFLDQETGKIDALVAEQERLIALLKEKRQAVISQAVTKGLNPNAPMKDSGIEWLGQVPAHWEVKRLKYLGEAIIGLTYEPANVTDESNGLLVLRSSNVQGGKITFDDNVYVSSVVPSKLITQVGDILICSRNGSRALIGKNATIDAGAAGLTFGAFMTVFRSQFNRYLSCVFNSPLFEFQSGAFLTSTINQLTVGILNDFEVPFPPSIERDQITSFISCETEKLNTLITEATQAITLLRERRAALISAAVTGKIDVRSLAPTKQEAA